MIRNALSLILRTVSCRAARLHLVGTSLGGPGWASKLPLVAGIPTLW